MRIKDYIKRLFEENNKKLVSNINTSIDTKIEESVPNIENVTTFTPIGTIIAVMGNEAPTNYLVCDGAIYNITDYQELANYFETQFGSKNKFGGNGTTTFAVPDLRGEFLRGTGTNSHENQGSGSAVGLHQKATEIPWLEIYHDSYIDGLFMYSNNSTDNYGIYNSDSKLLNRNYCRMFTTSRNDTQSTTQPKLITTRPTNTSVLYCIATKNIFVNPSLNFSTDEQVVGQWIDGKPIYQKTYYVSGISTSNHILNHDIENFGDAISMSAILIPKNSEVWYRFLPNASEVDIHWSGTFGLSSNQISLVIGSKLLERHDTAVVTIRYTKTTD